MKLADTYYKLKLVPIYFEGNDVEVYVKGNNIGILLADVAGAYQVKVEKVNHDGFVLSQENHCRS